LPKRDEIGQERGKKILVPNSVHNRPGEENSKKNSKKIEKIKKPHFGIIFSQNGNEIGQEREKKILVPNSVHTRPVQGNSEKNTKKFKNLISPLVLSKTG